MAIYVDALFRAHSADRQAERVGSRNDYLWCHLWSDSDLEELHAFAKKIGLRRQWFQDKPHFPHYDLTPGRRAAALKLGAIEGSTRDFVGLKRKS